VADKEHLARLKQGVEAWNAWREQNMEARPDLRGANLRKLDLSLANLRGADLSEAVFSKARLTNADLREADLREVNLCRAVLRKANLEATDLSGADLGMADLRKANLGGARLIRADLRGVKLRNANLRGVDFSRAGLLGASLAEAECAGAIFSETELADTLLAGAKGLDACEHRGPSVIDYRTLHRSGQLPLTFLRGCGLPDNLIEYLPSLLNQPFEFFSCFISYSSEDSGFAQSLHNDLQSNGVRCWFAPEDMGIGDKILDTLDEAIRLRDKVVLILSRSSINSDWVEDEVTKAFAEERKRKQTMLVPIYIDSTVLETQEAWAVKLRDNRHIGNFENWKNRDIYRKSFERLLRDLRLDREERALEAK
jgi:hypothetical protein